MLAVEAVWFQVAGPIGIQKNGLDGQTGYWNRVRIWGRESNANVQIAPGRSVGQLMEVVFQVRFD